MTQTQTVCSECGNVEMENDILSILRFMEDRIVKIWVNEKLQMGVITIKGILPQFSTQKLKESGWDFIGISADNKNIISITVEKVK